MLTGPVTILAWSFVRDDQPLGRDRQPGRAGDPRRGRRPRGGRASRIIQVDEPALREVLPLRDADQAAYLDWAVGASAWRPPASRDETQIHTHMCYSEFGDIIGAIADLDADVTRIEAARSHMEVLDDLEPAGYDNGIGPGVYDIHSPRVPTAEEMERTCGARCARWSRRGSGSTPTAG